MRRHRICALALVLTLWLSAAAAETWPTRPIRLITPFPPGGATDLLARAVGQKLGDALGQAVVVDNRPGAGGNLGAELAAKAPPDGYTLMMAPTSIYAVSATLYPVLSYDILRDFAPVSLIANAPHVLVVHADVPARSVAELIALAKARPGSLSVASQGVGTVSHLEGELFRGMAGVEWLHVPYKGSGPALVDLTAGQVQVMFDSVAASRPFVQAGKLHALAVTTGRRIAGWPELPTIAEAGLPGYAAETWLGVLAPVATPPAVIGRLNAALVTLLQEPETVAKLTQQGFEVQSSTPAALAEHMRAEVAKWAPVVRSSGAKPE